MLNQYELSRRFFDWCFENPEKIHTEHIAIYFFAMEHCNRLGWKEKYGFPSQMTMEAIGIKKHQTYIKYFRELVEYGFIKLIQESKNQYSANIISIQTAMPNSGKALDKALIKHMAKQTESTGQSTGQSTGHINKQRTNKQDNNEQINITFDTFWNLYNKKVGDKKDCEKKWNKLTDIERENIIKIIPEYILQFKEKQFQPHPTTFLNQRRWENEIIKAIDESKPIKNWA